MTTSGDAGVQVTWRPLTPQDVPAWLALDAACLSVDHRDDPSTAEELLEEFEPSWARPDELSIGAFLPDGELVALAWLLVRPDASRLPAHFLLHPAWRDHVVADRILDQVLGRARSRRSELPADATVEIHLTPEQPALVELLERRGFTPVRTWVEKRRDLAQPWSEPVLPADLRCEAWEPRWTEPTREAHIDAFLDHWGSHPPDPETWRLHYVGFGNFRADLSFVAADATDDVVGYVLSEAWPPDWELKGYRDAWIGLLGTRRARRGEGIASALIRTAMGAMRQDGFEYVSLGVDSESLTGANVLYDRLGFVDVRRTVSWSHPVTE